MKRVFDVLGRIMVFVLAAVLLGAQIVVEYDFYQGSHYGIADLFVFFPEWSYPLLSAGQLVALIYTWFKRATLKWWWYLVLPLIALVISAALTLLSPEVYAWNYHQQHHWG